MIATDLTTAARPLWRTIADRALAGDKGPHRSNLPGGVLQIEAKVDHRLMFAMISAHGRDVEAWEEEDLKAACEVPYFAERVPMAGQERVSRYRRGIVDIAPRHQITFWWALVDARTVQDESQDGRAGRTTQ